MGGPAASSAGAVTRGRGVVAGCACGHGSTGSALEARVPLISPEVCMQIGTSTLSAFVHRGALCRGGTTSRMKVAPRCYCNRIFSNTYNNYIIGESLLHLCVPLCAVAVSSALPNPFINFSVSISTWLWISVCNSSFKEAATVPYFLMSGKFGSNFWPRQARVVSNT